MDELLEQFLVESRELVTQAGKDLALLAHDPANTKTIDSAFRAFHTLKGSFAIFAQAPAERLLHRAEDLLDQLRKGKAGVEPAVLAVLQACLDQADRWIDAMAADGSLPASAGSVADAMLAGLAPPPEAAVKPAPPSDWLAALVAREAGYLAQGEGPLTAFRYRPDADCFFRGEDPLAVIEGLPQVVALAILPQGGAWPSADALEPFSCFVTIEGLCASAEADLRQAFRLQPDQVDLAPVDTGKARTEPQPENVMLRVAPGRVEALADGFRDLALAINRLGPLAEGLERSAPAMAARLRGARDEIERVTAGLHGHLARIRLVPLEPALRRLPRAAREIAQGLGKDLDFRLEGETIEADRQIAEGLFEPLLHLLRNAIDHGIEQPEARRLAGKPVRGQLRLVLAREGDAITATLSDDGAGIDPERLRLHAIQRGMLDAGGAMPGDREALRLIFEPGFSTASSVTDLSGRGVGLDAVRMAVTRLRGTIEVESQAGSGTIFRMRFPAQALTTRLLVVHAGGESFGLAFDQLVETMRIAAAAVRPAGLGQVCLWRGVTIPVVNLAALLDLEAVEDATARLVITRIAGTTLALRVDGFGENLDTVLRPPRGVLSRTHGIAGTALRDDGSVLLVLDLADLVS